MTVKKKKSKRMTVAEVLFAKALWYTLGDQKEVLVSRRDRQYWVSCEYPGIKYRENFEPNIKDGVIRKYHPNK